MEANITVSLASHNSSTDSYYTVAFNINKDKTQLKKNNYTKPPFMYIYFHQSFTNNLNNKNLS